jgi:hypothetical protein
MAATVLQLALVAVARPEAVKKSPDKMLRYYLR